MNGYLENTAQVFRINKLICQEEGVLFSERMSSRMVQCASALDEHGHIGWQLEVPVKGLVRMSVFGSGELNRRDLEWITEHMGKTARANGKTRGLESQLYELYLPAAERGTGNVIGFGAPVSGGGEVFSRWPSRYSGQFEELVRALRVQGGAFRAVIGPAGGDAQAFCRKNALRSFDCQGIDVQSYIARPVCARFLFRLAGQPTVRLRAVLGQAVPQARLRHLEDDGVWDAPLEGAAVLPDFAARILLLEPELRETVVGIELCRKTARLIPASHRNTKSARAVTVGKAVDAAGTKRTVTIGEVDLRRHYQIVGQTGTGKSTLLANLILSTIEQGYGLTFFDPHGSTISIVLRCLPEQYARRVRVVHIGDADHPVPLNIWDSSDPVKEERNISDLCELFADIFDPNGQGFVGPRYERWLSTFAKASLAFLGHRASLESIAILSRSQDNMLKLSKSIIGRYPDLVETIKQEYGTDKSSDFQNILNWYLSKFQRLTSVEQLRRTLGAGTNALAFPQTIDTDTVTLIDLGSPVIGAHAARIAGTLTLMKLWNAAMVRQDREKTHVVVVDEASLFQTNPMPRMLAEGRKFGLSMVLCHQHAGQLTSEIQDALEANSANFSAFRLSPQDAASAAVRFDDPAMRVSLTRLDAFRAVTTLSVDGRQTTPFTLEVQRPRAQKDGKRIAADIERHSIDTLVTPYLEDCRALTAAEIQKMLNSRAEKAAPKPVSEPELELEPLPVPVLPSASPLYPDEPNWLKAWRRKREDLGLAV